MNEVLMELLNENTIEIKKSKFIAYLYKIDSEEDAKKVLDMLWTEHKKARHIPYAYKLINTARKSDDKEPHNTAGLPILNVLERENLSNTMITVVRYFGGVKLGAGPLLRAYSQAANSVFKDWYEKNR